MESYSLEQTKLLGDQCFKDKDFEGAIEKYLQIIQNESSAGKTIFQNIALSYKKLGNWKEVEKFSNEALKIDDKYIKCLKLRGEAKVEMKKYLEGEEAVKGIDDGIEDIKKAHRLTHGQEKTNFNKEIEHALRISQKIKYYKQMEIDKQLKEELRSYLQTPIEENTDTRDEGDRLKTELDNLLQDDESEERKIPEFLTCPISLEVMTNPKLLSSGHTYEHTEIMKHIKRNGYTDPLTNERIKETKIDNINLRQAIEDYLEKNPWAYKYSKEDDYTNVSFEI